MLRFHRLAWRKNNLIIDDFCGGSSDEFFLHEYFGYRVPHIRRVCCGLATLYRPKIKKANG
jgi:hypothetical protein